MDLAHQSTRIAGCLVGLLVGNALAVPYDDMTPALMPEPALINLPPAPGWSARFPEVPSGAYSEDGAATLMMLSTLLNHGGFDSDGFLLRLRSWFERGIYAADNLTFDVAPQTQQALRRYASGLAAERCGSGCRLGDGGALARTAVLPLMLQVDDAALVDVAVLQTGLTHNSALSTVASAFFALWLRAELADEADSWLAATQRLRGVLPAAGPLLQSFERDFRPERRIVVGRSDHVVGLLQTTRTILAHTTDYAAAVRRVVSFGGNTPGAAAVVGAVAGLRYGLYGIPAAWRDRLRESALVRILMHEMLAGLQLPLVDI